MKLSNKTYDAIKWAVITASPALVMCIATVLPLYGVSAEVVNIINGTIGAITTLVGTLIGVSSISYKKENKNESKGK